MSRIRVSLIFASFALVAFAGTAHAQLRAETVELSPFYGRLFGGNFPSGSNALFSEKVDLDDSDAFGARLGYNLTESSEVEIQWSRTDTHFLSRDSGQIFGPDGTRLGDLRIDYVLGYYTFNFGHHRAVPYLSIGAGAARLDPSVSNEMTSVSTRLTGSLAGGLKVFVTPHFGLRFDARAYSTVLNGDDSCGHHDDCHTGRELTNGEASGGLILAF